MMPVVAQKYAEHLYNQNVSLSTSMDAKNVL